MTPPISGFIPVVIPSVQWNEELTDWTLMKNEHPPEPGLYLTYDPSFEPNKRILRWTGLQWRIRDLEVATNILAWKELDDSPSTSMDEEPCPVCGEGAPDLSRLFSER